MYLVKMYPFLFSALYPNLLVHSTYLICVPEYPIYKPFNGHCFLITLLKYQLQLAKFQVQLA